VLTRAEGEILNLPIVRDVLRRWGIELAPVETGDYIQVGVFKIPAILERLGKKKGEEMTRLLKIYLPTLGKHIGEIQALLASLDDRDPGLARILRWMPPEMLELANSKACRGKHLHQHC
jgi:DNA mismatch repair protein MLH3